MRRHDPHVAPVPAGGGGHVGAGVDHEPVAVVDDVMTTGSTLAEVKCTLLAAGVRQVDLWAVARVR